MAISPLQYNIYQKYVDVYPCSIASMDEEIDINDCLGISSDSLVKREALKKAIWHGNLLAMFEVDWSSIIPSLQCKNETFAAKGFFQAIIPTPTIEYDMVVSMSPKRRYTVNLNIEKIRKGTPKPISPEDY